MNDLQIEYFLTVADTLNFTKAAERLYVTQSAVSRQISGVEEELGIPLFDRLSKRIELTEAGVMFRDFYIDYRKRYNQLVERASAVSSNRMEKLVLGYMEGWKLSGGLIDLLNAFTDSHPNTEVVLECMSGRELMAALRLSRLDMVIADRTDFEHHKDITTEPLQEIPLLLFYEKERGGVSQDAKNTGLCLSDFRGDIFFSIAEDASNHRDYISKACMACGFSPRIQIVRSIESVFACVQSGMGVTISSGWSRAASSQGLDYIHLDGTVTVVLAVNDAHTSKASAQLAEEIRAYFGQPKNQDEII